MWSTNGAYLALLLLTGCGPSVSEEISDAIIAVNDSLEASRARIEHRGAALRAKLPPVPFADLGCPEFQLRADSMAMAIWRVEEATAPIFRDLTGVAQDDLEAGEKSFATDHQGEALFTAISEAYTCATAIAPDDSTRMRIAEMRISSFQHASPEAWRAADFTKAPRAAVVTILSKVQLDLENLRGMCDNALLKACLAHN